MIKKRFVYADNAATTRMSDTAVAAMLPYLTKEYGNASQPYSLARAPKKALREARKTIASCINAEPDEIYFTSCGTESDNWVIHTAIAQRWDIITSSIEHHAILNACKVAEATGRTVTYLPVSASGKVSPEQLQEQLHQSPAKLVSVMMSNNEIGTIEPIKQLAEVAHNNGAFFHTDAVQSMGHIPIDVKELKVDFLSASGHKFNGPKGIGFLYIKRGVEIPPFIYGGAQESGMRAGTENVASIVAMATALKENCGNLIANMSYVRMLEERLLVALQPLGCKVNDDSEHVPGNLSISFDGFSGEALLHRLDLLGISVSTGSACDSKNTQISHVLKAIGLPDTLALGTIRISLSKDNTEDDIDYIAECLQRIVRKQ